MKLHIDGELGATFAQTLCLIFFPGEKFSPVEEDSPDTLHVFFKAAKAEGIFTVEAVIKSGEKSSSASACEAVGRFGDEKAVKIAAGRAMLKAGFDFTGLTPPWGMLTGVRPSKVATAYIRDGLSEAETAAELERVYAVSRGKAELASAVAVAERRVMDSISQDECAVYVSIPFCPTRCAYCSFVSYTSPRLLSLIPQYLQTLADDIRAAFAKAAEDGKKVSSVYIGGGTPTILDARQLEFLLSVIEAETDVAALREFTLEGGRPDTITAEKLKVARDFGVGRVSINTQSLDDGVLETIGRSHTAADFFRAFEIARDSGIPCVNTDLIAGLPSDDEEKFKKTVDGVIALAPENITVHTFSVKISADIKRSGGKFLLKGKEYELHAAKPLEYSQRELVNNNYLPYYMYRQKNMVDNLENVGYAKAGFESVYNIVMMEEVCNIYAAGAGAVTKLLKYIDGKLIIERIFNAKYPYEYLRG